MTVKAKGYRFADVQINVSAPEYEEPYYLAPFRHDAPEADYVFNVRAVHGINAPALPCIRKSFSDAWYSDGTESCYTVSTDDDGIMLKAADLGHRCEVEFSALHPEYFGANLLMRAMRLPELLLRSGAVFLHASYIIYSGMAILFTADKQVGKSTQASLWEKYAGAEIINGDRALIRKVGNKWTAFGSPYCGSSRICKNASAEIAAIVILGQADENTVRKAETPEALAALLSGLSYDTEDRSSVEAVFDICVEMAESVPFYRLDCLPDSSAVYALKEALGDIK